MVSPEEITKTEFAHGTRERNYDEIEVDDYLDEVVRRMRAGTLDPAFVEPRTFNKVKGFGRRGYNVDQVDDLLARIRATTTGLTDGAVGASQDTVRQDPFIHEQPGFLARLFGKR